MRLKLTLLLCLLALFTQTTPVSAHANLARSTPAANARLDTSPAEIRLWFTEPLEPDYSRIVLRDSSGTVLATPPSEVIARDQLLLRPGALPEGLYTVSWRSLSAADGHTSEGSFVFGIGIAVAGELAAPQVDESLPVQDIGARLANLVSLSLLVGTIGFVLWVWLPTTGESTASPLLYRLAWLGWIAVGVSGVLMLMMQATAATDMSLTEINYGEFVMGTTYGRLWLLRNSIWFFIGVVLDIKQRPHLALWGVLFLCGGLLFTQSLFSHASVAEDAAAAIAGGWLHLLVSSLWIGGLIAFSAVLWSIRGSPDTGSAGRLVAHFSNYARVGVLALSMTGFYAAWLHVGSVDALLSTVYGRLLLAKLVLFLPLLALAAINLIFTSRGLQRGQEIWVRRLRGLVGAEVALTILVLVAAAALTSAVPARDVMVTRAAVPIMPESESYLGMELIDNEMFHFEVYPGYVGENTFTVLPFDIDGNPVEDASLIRLRFDNLDQNLGQSELRPTAEGGGIYIATGANLSAPGRWRVRMTLQRPGVFDKVIDYELEVKPPPPLIIPPIEDALPLDQRWLFAGITGIVLAGVGGFTFASQKPRLQLRSSLALALIGVGVLFTLSAITPFAYANLSGQLAISDAWALPTAEGMSVSVYMQIENPGILTESIVGAETEIAESVELHENMVMSDMMHMMRRGTLDIPANGSLNLQQNALYHMMLIGITRELQEGDSFSITLQLDSGREVTTQVNVEFPEQR